MSAHWVEKKSKYRVRAWRGDVTTFVRDTLSLRSYWATVRYWAVLAAEVLPEVKRPE